MSMTDTLEVLPLMHIEFPCRTAFIIGGANGYAWEFNQSFSNSDQPNILESDPLLDAEEKNRLWRLRFLVHLAID